MYQSINNQQLQQNNEDEQMIQSIELSVAAKNLKKGSDIQLVLFMQNKNDKSSKWEEFQKTEVKQLSLNPEFYKKFYLIYEFEKIQIEESNKNTFIYETEVVQNSLNPLFKRIQFNTGNLCHADNNWPVLVEVWDYSVLGAHEFFGNFQFTVEQLNNKFKTQKQNSCEFQIMNQNKSQGKMIIQNFQLDENFQFLQYVDGGLQLSLIGAIDFTESNLKPTDPQSLHYISQNKYNQYQSALKSVSDILLNYDYDQQVPMFGFGAKVNNNPKIQQKSTLHCFPLNGNPENPEVDGLQGIMNSYLQSLQTVTLSGPTLFQPIIQQALQIAQGAKNNSLNDALNDIYYVLLILTDGMITDMQQTIKSIVDCSELPISIIIVGVGDADFTQMEILDSDDQTLQTQKGEKAKRDLVQFVPYNKFKNNPVKFSEEVLKELPTQVEQYMRLVNRKPIVDLTTQQIKNRQMDKWIYEKQISKKDQVILNALVGNQLSAFNNNDNNIQQQSNSQYPQQIVSQKNPQILVSTGEYQQNPVQSHLNQQPVSQYQQNYQQQQYHQQQQQQLNQINNQSSQFQQNSVQQKESQINLNNKQSYQNQQIQQSIQQQQAYQAELKIPDKQQQNKILESVTYSQYNNQNLHNNNISQVQNPQINAFQQNFVQESQIYQGQPQQQQLYESATYQTYINQNNFSQINHPQQVQNQYQNEYFPPQKQMPLQVYESVTFSQYKNQNPDLIPQINQYQQSYAQQNSPKIENNEQEHFLDRPSLQLVESQIKKINSEEYINVSNQNNNYQINQKTTLLQESKVQQHISSYDNSNQQQEESHQYQNNNQPVYPDHLIQQSQSQNLHEQHNVQQLSNSEIQREELQRKFDLQEQQQLQQSYQYQQKESQYQQNQNQLTNSEIQREKIQHQFDEDYNNNQSIQQKQHAHHQDNNENNNQEHNPMTDSEIIRDKIYQQYG